MRSHVLGDESPDLVSYGPDIRRIRAPNPSPMTERGTNTYLVGRDEVAVIDPGPASPEHLDRILAELGSAHVQAILVTHSHRDHSTLAPALSAATGAPVLAFGGPEAGRRRTGLTGDLSGLGGGEGVDAGFRPDEVIPDGHVITAPGWRVQALWTPGHMANHLCFACGDVLFSGDLVMGWATSLVSPPDGDLTAFYASCARLQARSDRLFLPGHGPAIPDPQQRIAELIAHRAQRTAQLINALQTGPGSVGDLTRQVYQDLPEALLPAAERNLLAHLIALLEQGRVTTARPLSLSSRFALAPQK